MSTEHRTSHTNKRERLTALAVVILIAITTWFGLGWFLPAAPPPAFPGESLEINVFPNAIPISGEWTVVVFLVSPESEVIEGVERVAVVRRPVESNVTMMATIDAPNPVIETKLAANGETTFRVRPNTVAVTFQAERVHYYQIPSGNTTWVQRDRITVSQKIPGPQVLKSEEARFWISFAGIFTVGYFGWTGTQLRDERIRARWRGLILLSSLLCVMVIVGYVVVEVRRWLPTGYFPLYWLGLPIYFLFLIPASMWCISFAFSQYQKKRAKRVVASDALL